MCFINSIQLKHHNNKSLLSKKQHTESFKSFECMEVQMSYERIKSF